MNATVTIYHNVSEWHDGPDGGPSGRFWSFCPNCELERAYSYETQRAWPEAVWEDNQAVEGLAARNVEHGKRSLSMGDVVMISDDETSSYYAVEAVGFRGLAVEELFEAMKGAV